MIYITSDKRGWFNASKKIFKRFTFRVCDLGAFRLDAQWKRRRRRGNCLTYTAPESNDHCHGHLVYASHSDSNPSRYAYQHPYTIAFCFAYFNFYPRPNAYKGENGVGV